MLEIAQNLELLKNLYSLEDGRNRFAVAFLTETF
jgi:hypothetical protein